jgi:tRNA threonylcarbamoyladenosine biosynthesis protein TsaE
MMLVLREANESDAETLLALIQAAFAEYIGNIDPPSSAPDETIEGIRAKLESAMAVLALVDDTPAGCVFIQVEKEHLYLFRLAVHPGYRRRGIGRSLIEFVEHRAIAMGGRRCTSAYVYRCPAIGTTTSEWATDSLRTGSIRDTPCPRT